MERWLVVFGLGSLRTLNIGGGKNLIMKLTNLRFYQPEIRVDFFYQNGKDRFPNKNTIFLALKYVSFRWKCIVF